MKVEGVMHSESIGFWYKGRLTAIDLTMMPNEPIFVVGFTDDEYIDETVDLIRQELQQRLVELNNENKLIVQNKSPSSNFILSDYKSSEMNTSVLGSVVTAGSTASGATINQQLYAEFGSHLKTTRELVSKSINTTGYNRFGVNSGCSNDWEWVNAQAILMSEIEVYGSIVWSSSGYDTGNANHQFELFANSKSAINNRSAWYWLKDVASSSNWCYCNINGYSCYDGASNAYFCVRPRFVLA